MAVFQFKHDGAQSAFGEDEGSNGRYRILIAQFRVIQLLVKRAIPMQPQKCAEKRLGANQFGDEGVGREG